MPAKKVPTVVRFWKRVNKTPTCWLWTGPVDSWFGRGAIKLSGTREQMFVHRFSWLIHKGEIPKGLFVLHKCDVPHCVNPDHLFLGTHRDNMHDCFLKKRNYFGERHHASKLTRRDIPRIKALRAKGWSQQKIADQFGVSQVNISSVLRSRTWKNAQNII